MDGLGRKLGWQQKKENVADLPHHCGEFPTSVHFCKVHDSLKRLTEQVREHRSHLSICPSAKDGVDVKQLICEFLNKKFYKGDYDTITRALIFDDVSYEQAAATLKEIADKLF